jgi:hypothetical protein
MLNNYKCILPASTGHKIKNLFSNYLTFFLLKNNQILPKMIKSLLLTIHKILCKILCTLICQVNKMVHLGKNSEIKKASFDYTFR